MDWTVDVAAAALGLAGLVLAAVANGRAQKANQAAEVANGIAADALREARAANRIAEQANQLSQDANTIVGGQAARESERWHVDWSAQWQVERDTLVLRNTGAELARQVAVVVRGHEFHHVARDLGDSAAGGELALPLPEVAEQRAEYDRVARDGAADRVLGFRFRLDVVVTITWVTGLGQPQRADLEVQLS